jgi:hypothetical protein
MGCDLADMDYVEWIFAVQAVEAIRYKGQPADIYRFASVPH